MRIYTTFLLNLFILPLFLFLITSCGADKGRFSEKEYEEINNQIHQLSKDLTSDPGTLGKFLNGVNLDNDLRNYLQNFYEQREHDLAWISLADIKPEAKTLVDQVRKAHEHGLDSTIYNLEEIKVFYDTLYNNPGADDQLAAQYLKLDYIFTATYLSFASHLSGGVIDPEIADSNWVHYQKEIQWDSYLQKALDDGDIEASLEELVPQNPQYALLKDKLAAFRAKAENETIPALIPTTATMKPGESSEAIGLVKKRLIFWGDLDEKAADSKSVNVYDEQLEQAITKFQARHGILEDGKLGPETISMLNASLQSRIDQISLNMERLRWLPEDIGTHYVWVNIPEYQVKIINNGKEDLKMRVIVGERMNATPIFSDTMEFLVFSPTWTVPKSISTEEMLPKIKEDEDYFKDKNLLLYENWSPGAEEIDPEDVNWKKIDKEDFNFKIVEKPGKENALGSVKFMFPNSEAIYLHDTPADHLFEETERGFSHGCIRVEKPKELAEYLLEDNGDEKWDMEKISEFMELDTPTTVTLKRKLPVHIVYHSAWVDEDAVIHFRKDIYSHDRTQKQAIDKKEELLM